MKRKHFGWGMVLLTLAACGPSEQQKAKWAEEKRVDCLDKICAGDMPPKLERPLEWSLMKLNGEYFIAPRAYAKGHAGLAFYWPSRTPVTGLADRQPYPEQGADYSEVAIEIFLRSSNIPSEPQGYKLIELAEANGWIESRRPVRAGLDAIVMKHVIGPNGQYIDHVTYYVATLLTGLDGLPPVATCSHDDPRNGGGSGFVWQPGIWAGVRMNQRHCADWPEIYQEVIRVIQQLRKA